MFLFNLLRYHLFWMLLFPLFRLLFVVFNYNIIKSEGAEIVDLLPVLWYAMELDWSMASYISALCLILLLVNLFVRTSVMNKLLNVYTYILIVLYSLLGVGEIALYPEWKVKVNAKALEYLSRPTEVLGSNRTWDSIWQLGLWLILSYLFILFYRFLFQKRVKIEAVSPPIWSLLLTVPLSLGVSVLGMRGGVQEIPISQSQSYFSKYNVVNDLAVNSSWNLIHNLANTLDISESNIFKTFDDQEAKRRVEALHKVEKDSTVSILNHPKPNVLFLIMESWNADMIVSLGGREGATPHFERAIEKGLLFSKCYSSGNRSQQGLASILGGFPALPITTLTTVPDKTRKTATITSELVDNGYHSAFYYGGELRYGNIKAYLLHNRFHEIIEGEDWESQIPRGKLGIHDEYMYEKVQQKLKTLPEPFFVNFFTLSSHSPYDQPQSTPIDWGDSEDDFHTSIYYSDSCLGVFLEEAEKADWYDNTLIVIVSDHSHQTYTHYPIHRADYRRIPMLFLGGALKKEYRGMRLDKICSQTDIGKTLLNQLNVSSEPFFWSRDIMNQNNSEFAFFELNNGFGWIKPEGELSYNHLNRRMIYSTFTNDSLEQQAYEEGASYLQQLFQEFVDL